MLSAWVPRGIGWPLLGLNPLVRLGRGEGNLLCHLPVVFLAGPQRPSSLPSLDFNQSVYCPFCLMIPTPIGNEGERKKNDIWDEAWYCGYTTRKFHQHFQNMTCRGRLCYHEDLLKQPSSMYDCASSKKTALPYYASARS